MLFEAERLGNINRDVNGLNVKVVELQKIYNEFSSVEVKLTRMNLGLMILK